MNASQSSVSSGRLFDFCSLMAADESLNAQSVTTVKAYAVLRRMLK